MRVYFSLLLISGLLIGGMSVASVGPEGGAAFASKQEALLFTPQKSPNGQRGQLVTATDSNATEHAAQQEQAGAPHAREPEAADETADGHGAAEYTKPQTDAGDFSSAQELKPQTGSADSSGAQESKPQTGTAGSPGVQEPIPQTGTVGSPGAQEPIPQTGTAGFPGTATSSSAQELKPQTGSAGSPGAQEPHLRPGTATSSNALGQPVPLDAATPANAALLAAQPDITPISTEEELMQWVDELDDLGGEAVLERPITITDPNWSCTFLYQPAVIHTGAFGLIYDGSYISASSLELVGDGVDMPVLEIKSTGEYNPWNACPDWNQNLNQISVTAAGRDGLGGVAVLITADRKERSPIYQYKGGGSIRSYGSGAVGLKFAPDISPKTYFLSIDVQGENACAIAAPGGADLFGCRLSAEGNGAVVADAGVILDTCVLSPEPDGNTVIRRVIERRVGIDPQIKQNSDPLTTYNAVGLFDIQRYVLTGGQYLDLRLLYDDQAVEQLDTGVLGKIDIPVSLPAYMQGLGLENGEDFTFPVWICDPALPILESVTQDDNVLTFFSWYGSVIEPGTILWCSEDGGTTWADVTDWDAVQWQERPLFGDLFQMNADSITKPLLLALENHAGWGNLISLIPGEEGVINPGSGGDRDGGDRDEQPGSGGGEHFPDDPTPGPETEDPPQQQPSESVPPVTNQGSGGSGSSSSHAGSGRPGAHQTADETLQTGPAYGSIAVDAALPENAPGPAHGSTDAGAALPESASGPAGPGANGDPDIPPAGAQIPVGKNPGDGASTAPASGYPASASPHVNETPSQTDLLPGAAPETESAAEDAVRPANAPASHGWGLSLTALCAAGGVTALAAFRTKRRDR